MLHNTLSTTILICDPFQNLKMFDTYTHIHTHKLHKTLWPLSLTSLQVGFMVEQHAGSDDGSCKARVVCHNQLSANGQRTAFRSARCIAISVAFFQAFHLRAILSAEWGCVLCNGCLISSNKQRLNSK